MNHKSIKIEVSINDEHKRIIVTVGTPTVFDKDQWPWEGEVNKWQPEMDFITHQMCNALTGQCANSTLDKLTLNQHRKLYDKYEDYETIIR